MALVVFTGGARSGKSALAQDLAALSDDELADPEFSLKPAADVLWYWYPRMLGITH